jgi:hypothetical protein
LALMPPIEQKLEGFNNSSFDLNFSGVAGFFGGNVAVEAMSTVHLYRGRKWLGWYNSPGSYEIAKSYGQLCKSRFWDGIYPGANVEPTRFFGLDGQDGPAYRALHSGTCIPNTGHVAHLLLESCHKLPIPTQAVVNGRQTTPMTVTVVDLPPVSKETINPRPLSSSSPLLATFPILATLAAAVACGIVQDWCCFNLIIGGGLSSGLSCLAIGSATLSFTHPTPANGAPRGDGILEKRSDVVILLGEEGAVNTVTRGAFKLKFKSEPAYHDIGICSLCLLLQFLAQLLLLPLGTLFGQLMFLGSLFVSWAYNSFLCSLDREVAQREILYKQILGEPLMKKFLLPSRTAMVTFVLLVLANSSSPETTIGNDPSSEKKQNALRKQLDALLPNDTEVWQKWKEETLEKIMNPSKFTDAMPSIDGMESELLKILRTDAMVGYDGYLLYTKPQGGEPLR